MTPEARLKLAKAVPVGRIGWFDALLRSGAIDRWLASEETSELDYALVLMGQPEVLSKRGPEVATRLRAIVESPNEGNDEAKRKALRFFSFNSAHTSPEMFALFLALLRRGEFGETVNQWWHQFYRLPDDNPTSAVNLLAAVFDRFVVTKKDAEGDEDVDFSGIGLPEDFIPRTAVAAPSAFVRAMLPRLVGLIQAHTVSREDEGVTDRIWPWLMLGFRHEPKWALLDGLVTAMGLWAKQEPERFDELTASLQLLPHRNIGFLLLSAWSAHPTRYADRIVAYLLEHPQYLNLGYAILGSGNGHSAIARAAIAAATLACSDELLGRLEALILSFHPAIERSEPRRFGYTQTLLLHAIEPSRLSASTRARLEELDRKFPDLDLSPPRGSEGASFVPSPIRAEAAAKMSDEHWIGAMRKYKMDRSEDPSRWILGGASELGRELEYTVRQDKDRFASLAVRLGPEIAPIYFDAILRGLVATKDESKGGVPKDQPNLPPVSRDLLLFVFRHVHDLPERPCGRWLVAGIGASASYNLPDDILAIVCWYAQQDPDPQTVGDPGSKYFGGDLVNQGINTVRGAAADALSKLLFAKPERWPKLEAGIVSVVRDPSWSVQAVAITCLIAVLNVDRTLAVRLFIEQVQKTEALLSSMFVGSFFYHAVLSHYRELRTILLSMLDMAGGTARETAARTITLASFRIVEANEDMARVIKGDDVGRAAWANIAAANLKFPEQAARCRAWLIECFRDLSPKVHQAASRCFHEISSDQLCAEGDLIDRFLGSSAFEANANMLLMALEQAVDRLPDVVCRIPEKAIELYRNSSEKDGYHWWAHQMSVLVLRLYNQTRDPGVRSRCLNVIDTMIEFDFGGVGAELTKFERT